MEMNHHIMAKATTDAILDHFKSGKWTCCGNMGTGFYRVGCDASFPSPDATFADDGTNAMACFEFKPPTETKRGILTGVGQCIAYLQNCDLAFLIAPKMLEDFRLGDYLSDMYSQQITNKIPVGLILYDNNNPNHVFLTKNVDAIEEAKHNKAIAPTSRFWAKHQDLPVELFHLLLHCYYLKKVQSFDEDAFTYCWNNYLIDPDVPNTLQVKRVLDCTGKPIHTLGGRKEITFLDKKINDYKDLPSEERHDRLAHDIDVTFQGDNYYRSIRKNYETFLKHIGMIDSEYNLTDDGYVMYHLGLANGPGSKLFNDYFAKIVLMKGHHLDLLLDIDLLRSKHLELPVRDVLKTMYTDYQNRGMIKKNPGRQVATVSNVGFLKYEFILWKAMGIIRKDYSIDWKRVTEICLLPDK